MTTLHPDKDYNEEIGDPSERKSKSTIKDFMGVGDHRCAFCNSPVEKIAEDNYNCSNCGFGWNGKAGGNMNRHIRNLMNLTKYLIVQFPNKTQGEYVNMVMEKLHAIEKHPLDRDGYCEYCNVRFEQH